LRPTNRCHTPQSRSRTRRRARVRASSSLFATRVRSLERMGQRRALVAARASEHARWSLRYARSGRQKCPSCSQRACARSSECGGQKRGCVAHSRTTRSEQLGAFGALACGETGLARVAVSASWAPFRRTRDAECEPVVHLRTRDVSLSTTPSWRVQRGSPRQKCPSDLLRPRARATGCDRPGPPCLRCARARERILQGQFWRAGSGHSHVAHLRASRTLSH
jgi:hypothetical protein